jgi:hypothetical protein
MGDFNGKINGLDEVIGITDASMLRSIIKSPGFKTLSATAVIVKSEKLSAGHILLSNNTGHKYKLPVVSESRIDTLIPPAKPTMEITIAVRFTPDADGIYRFKYWQKKMFEYIGGDYVGFYTSNDIIHCHYNSGVDQCISFPFGYGVVGCLKNDWKYRNDKIASVLNLYPTAKYFCIEMSDLGAIIILINTNFASYRFYFLARQR